MLGDENGNQMEDLFYLRLGGRILLQASEQRETFATDTDEYKATNRDEDIAADTDELQIQMKIKLQILMNIGYRYR